MGFLDDMIADDAAIFTDPDLCAEVESVQFVPAGTTTPVSLSVQVFREPPRNLGRGQVAGKLMKVFVRRHATLGRTSINASGDVFLIPFKKGGAAERKAVVQIESEDAGGFMLVLE